MASQDDDHALVRRDGTSGLQQQGTIDWTRLGSSMVTFSVEFLVRMSNGGVEGITIHAARAVLSRLKLSSHGEQRVHDAVSKLSAFSSINTALWFGFGVKHVIRQLAESEQGLNCIAVCSALQEMYSTSDTAKIMRELMKLSGAPLRLTPSIRQWISLVEVCGGALASTDFGAHLHDVSRHFLPQNIGTLRRCSEPEYIANVINALINVSNGTIESFELSGGADCAWIAAFAIWMLDLPVVVRDCTENELYRYPEQGSLDPKLTIVCGDSSLTSLQMAKKSFIIPSGDVILRENDIHRHFARGGDVLSYGRVPWESLLKDTFGKPARLLILGPLVTSCGTLLGCAARIFSGILSGDTESPDDCAKYRLSWNYVASSSHGRGFVNTVRRRLPELAASERLMDAIEHAVSSTYMDAVSTYEQHMLKTADICLCERCKPQRHEVRNGSTTQEFCLVSLVECVIELVQILSQVSVQTNILPARSGLESIYWYHWTAYWTQGAIKKRGPSYVYDCLLEQEGRSTLFTAKCLFEGRENAQESAKVSAVAVGGLCLYYDILVEFSATQDRCRLVHVIPGRVEWQGNLFNRVNDLPREPLKLRGPQYQAALGAACSATSIPNLESSTSPDIRYELLIEDNEESHAKSLLASYRFSTDQGRFRFGPYNIMYSISTATTAKDCRGRSCGPLPAFDIRPVLGEGVVNAQGMSSNMPLIFVAPQQIPAQLVAASQDEIWAPATQNQPFDHMIGRWNYLQDKECLRCLVMRAINTYESEDTGLSRTPFCIVTSNLEANHSGL